MHGVPARSATMCWSSGLEISTAAATRPSSAHKLLLRCSSGSWTLCTLQNLTSGKSPCGHPPVWHEWKFARHPAICRMWIARVTATTWYNPGQVTDPRQRHHRRVWLDTRTGQQACPPYDPQFVRSEVFEFWPSDMLRLFAQAGMPRRQAPPPGDCDRRMPGGHAPSINSPLRNATYTLRAARVGTETIALAATAMALCGHCTGSSMTPMSALRDPTLRLSWAPGRSGAFLVRAVDDQGRADSRELRVAVIP